MFFKLLVLISYSKLIRLLSSHTMKTTNANKIIKYIITMH